MEGRRAQLFKVARNTAAVCVFFALSFQKVRKNRAVATRNPAL